MPFYSGLIRGLLLGTFMVAPLSEAQESQWQSLAEIRAGTKVQVVEKSLKSTSGKFMGFSQSGLTLMVGDKELVVPRDQVCRVSVSGKNRKRNVLIGVAIGTAAGAGVGAAARRVAGENWVIPGLALAYGGVGAGIGALVPATKTIYRVQAPKPASLKTQSP